MKAHLILMVALVLAGHGTSAAAAPVFIHGELSVRAYAIECQHPAKKTDYDARLSACTSYIRGAVEQIALAKRSSKCWEAIEAGKAAPAVIDAVLFNMATVPEESQRQLHEAVQWIVLNIAAKECR